MTHTTVQFLINDTDPNAIDLFAFFPDTMQAYSHIGQHSNISYEYAGESREATKEEYHSLHNELIAIGYSDLHIINKSK